MYCFLSSTSLTELGSTSTKSHRDLTALGSLCTRFACGTDLEPCRTRQPGHEELRGLLEGLIALHVRVNDACQRDQNGDEHQREDCGSPHRFLPPFSHWIHVPETGAELPQKQKAARSPETPKRPPVCQVSPPAGNDRRLLH